MLIWGVHVHVGVKHREHVFPIISSLLSQFPHLLAPSASSPIWASTDTGVREQPGDDVPAASHGRPPLQFGRWEEFETFVAEQERTGVIESLRDLRWDIRPSPRFGTVEVRVCDGISTIAELRAVVALIHCLVVELEERLASRTYPRRGRRTSDSSGSPPRPATTWWPWSTPSCESGRSEVTPLGPGACLLRLLEE
ncbi:MAG TPA: glutamate-cysteine ligase family protein [Nocardioidaceae bacterium]|nr:glutamate-cysteine ligase family protein [Nocardioidaceae bacterium]